MTQVSGVGFFKLSDINLMQVSRPKMEISLPYKDYKLVTSDGRALDRRDKHPFCMSRVYYSRDERPEEDWAEDSAGNYRWRQSSSEIKLIALKVRPLDSLSNFMSALKRCLGKVDNLLLLICITVLLDNINSVL